MKQIDIYVEGGAKGRGKHKEGSITQCRQAFKQLLGDMLEGKNVKLNIRACGSRNEAYKDFGTALKNAKRGDVILLLVDSEAPINPTHDNKPWEHVKHLPNDKWNKPQGATDDSLHFMVECMGAWFLADRECLEEYFGAGFNTKHLPRNPNIEEINKSTLISELQHATKNSQKGCYNKGNHSFYILSKIRHKKLIAASKHAKRLKDTLTSE